MRKHLSIFLCFCLLFSLLPFVPASAAKSPLTRIEAEAFDSKTGRIVSQACQDTGGGENICYITKADHIVYRNFTFTGVEKSVLFRIASKAEGTLYVRLDGTENEPIATLEVPFSGGVQEWTTIQADLPEAVSGTHDIYLTFDNSQEESYTFLNINYFQFSNAYQAPVTAPDFGLTTFDASSITIQTPATMQAGYGIRVIWANTKGEGGAKITFSSPSAGYRRLFLTYSMPHKSGRPTQALVFVNKGDAETEGGIVADMPNISNFAPNGSVTYSIVIPVVAGSNTVRIASNQYAPGWQFWLKEISVSKTYPFAGDVPTPFYEASPNDIYQTIPFASHANQGSNAIIASTDSAGGVKNMVACPQTTMVFPSLDFGDGGAKSLSLRANSNGSARTIAFRLDRADGPLIAIAKTEAKTGWQMVQTGLHITVSGVHTLYASVISGDVCLSSFHFTKAAVADYTPTDPSVYRDTYSDTWVATDDLGRTTPTNETVGDKKDRVVGMFYFLWHQGSNGNLYDHYAAYKQGGVNQVWNTLVQGARGYQHYWAEPYFGYYSSNDEWVIRKHAQMLVNAGVDFIFFDCSNNLTYPDTAIGKVMKVFHEIREEGGMTPQIVYFLGDNADFGLTQATNIYYDLYAPGLYEDLWFQWDGKPLLLGNLTKVTDQAILDAFTIKRSWANPSSNNWFGDGKDKWPWAALYPQITGKDKDGKVEQCVVMCGFWANSSQGRSYTNNTQPTTGKNDFEFGLLEDGPYGGTSGKGLAYDEQWSRAYRVDPPVIMITGWNEWWAGRWEGGAAVGQKIANTYTVTGDSTKREYNYYVDNFNPEFSRDLEPMKGGFGDNYYYQTVSRIRQYKGVRSIPEPSGQKEIAMTTDFTQWETVGPEFRDTLYDTTHRDCVSNALPTKRYTNTSGRNDIDIAKVSRTQDVTYFYVRTRENLTAPTGTNWMNLYIDVDQNASTGWKGYDFVINRTRNGNMASIERSVNNSWNWSKVGEAQYVMSGKELQIAIPNEILDSSMAAFDFKWADNSTTTGDIMQFMDLGDAAPDDRFNFRYQTASPITSSHFYEDFSNGYIANNWTNLSSSIENTYQKTEGVLKGSGTMVQGFGTKVKYGTEPYLLSYDVQGNKGTDAGAHMSLFAGLRMKSVHTPWSGTDGLYFAFRDNSLYITDGNIIGNIPSIIAINNLPVDFSSGRKRVYLYDTGSTITVYAQGDTAETAVPLCSIAVDKGSYTVSRMTVQNGAVTLTPIKTKQASLASTGYISFGSHGGYFQLDNIRISTEFEAEKNMQLLKGELSLPALTSGTVTIHTQEIPYTGIVALYDSKNKVKNVKVAAAFTQQEIQWQVSSGDKIKVFTWESVVTLTEKSASAIFNNDGWRYE